MDDRQSGMTLVEIMLVVAVLAVLAGLLIPNYIEMRERAIWSLAVSNLKAAHAGLAYYRISNGADTFPDSPVSDYSTLKGLLPTAGLPETCRDAGWLDGSLQYTPSADATDFTLIVRANGRRRDMMVLTSAGVSPSTYPH